MRNRLSTLACTSSIGPGATNMVTGAALATVNRLPVLLLPGDVFATRAPHPVLQQLEHLRRYRLVSDAEARGDLHVTGMYFDVGAAQVYLFDSATDSFTGVGVAQAVASES